VWFPNLAPSVETIKLGQEANRLSGTSYTPLHEGCFDASEFFVWTIYPEIGMSGLVLMKKGGIIFMRGEKGSEGHSMEDV